MECLCFATSILLLIAGIWILWEIRCAPEELDFWKGKWKGKLE